MAADPGIRPLWHQGFLDGLSLSAVALRRAHTALLNDIPPPDVPTPEWDLLVRGFGIALETVENLEMTAAIGPLDTPTDTP